MYLIGFPLLVVPFAIYNMIAFLTPGMSWTDTVASIHRRIVVSRSEAMNQDYPSRLAKSDVAVEKLTREKSAEISLR